MLFLLSISLQGSQPTQCSPFEISPKISGALVPPNSSMNSGLSFFLQDFGKNSSGRRKVCPQHLWEGPWNFIFLLQGPLSDAMLVEGRAMESPNEQKQTG